MSSVEQHIGYVTIREALFHLMKMLERKQKIRRAIYSTPSLVVLLVISFILVKGVVGVMNKEWESRERLTNLEEKADSLVILEGEIKEGIRRLETEEGIKNEIRERFNVTQEGELVAVIVEESGASSSTDDSARPWYRKFWDAIMPPYGK